MLRVGVKSDAPPFGWKDEFGYYGFDVDIANALATELKIPKVEFVTVTSADRLDKVAAGDVHMAIASMTITRGREAKVDFGFNEWFRAQDGTPCGQDWQTWSAAMYLYAATSVEQKVTPFFQEIRREV